MAPAGTLFMFCCGMAEAKVVKPVAGICPLAGSPEAGRSSCASKEDVTEAVEVVVSAVVTEVVVVVAVVVVAFPLSSCFNKAFCCCSLVAAPPPGAGFGATSPAGLACWATFEAAVLVPAAPCPMGGTDVMGPAPCKTLVDMTELPTVLEDNAL